LNSIQIKQKMKNYIRLILAIPFVLFSCKKEVEPKENTTTTRVIPFTEVGNQMRNEAAAKNAALPNQNSNSSSGATTGGELNPAHGQAGHRCDLAVGAPLNTGLAKANSNTVTVPKMKVTPTVTNTTTTTPTPEGMNPPHGQDGHRCDIAVGAALPK
jgi:hypothetical protein